MHTIWIGIDFSTDDLNIRPVRVGKLWDTRNPGFRFTTPGATLVEVLRTYFAGAICNTPGATDIKALRALCLKTTMLYDALF